MARLGNVDQTINYEWLGYHDFNGGYKVEAGERASFYMTAAEDDTQDYIRVAITNNGLDGVLSYERGTNNPVSGVFQVNYLGSRKFSVQSSRVSFDVDVRLIDNEDVAFGSSDDALVRWETTETNDALKIGIALGTSAQSGNIIVCEKDDIAVNFGHAVSVDPTMFLHSADATTTTDWLGLWCDQTGNGHVEVGGNGLILGSAAKGLGFYGGAPAPQSTGWNPTNVVADKVFDAAATTLNELAHVVGTMINELKTITLFGA